MEVDLGGSMVNKYILENWHKSTRVYGNKKGLELPYP